MAAESAFLILIRTHNIILTRGYISLDAVLNFSDEVESALDLVLDYFLTVRTLFLSIVIIGGVVVALVLILLFSVEFLAQIQHMQIAFQSLQTLL